jgi:hypothetical protein
MHCLAHGVRCREGLPLCPVDQVKRVPEQTILTAHVLVKLALTVVGMALMVAAGKRYYPIRIDVPIFGFAMALLISTWSILSIGFLIASIVPTARFAQPIGAAILYPMLALCGLFVPIQSLSPALAGRGAHAAVDLRGSATGGDLERRGVVGAHWRHRGPGGRICGLHGTLGEGVSLGIVRVASESLLWFSHALFRSPARSFRHTRYSTTSAPITQEAITR